MKNTPIEKPNLHPNNLHRQQYNFDELSIVCPQLSAFVSNNKFGNTTINFADAQAIKMLNTAILKHFYKLKFWDIPPGYLCPPIPGRADYVHHLVDLLSAKSTKITALDIGTGANLVYPIVGNAIYNWQFVASDINKVALLNAQNIIDKNAHLLGKITLRKQANVNHIFDGIILPNDKFSFTICNPPFHESAAEAYKANNRKNSNLHGTNTLKSKLNFGGIEYELWCNGGEKQFIENMILESKIFAKQCLWFTTLVSNKRLLPAFVAKLKGLHCTETKIIDMAHGNKVSRILAWTFLNENEKEMW